MVWLIAKLNFMLVEEKTHFPQSLFLFFCAQAYQHIALPFLEVGRGVEGPSPREVIQCVQLPQLGHRKGQGVNPVTTEAPSQDFKEFGLDPPIIAPAVS